MALPTKRPPFRPRLPPHLKRSETLQVPLNDEERQRLQRLSAQRGEPYAVVVRAALLAMDRGDRSE